MNAHNCTLHWIVLVLRSIDCARLCGLFGSVFRLRSAPLRSCTVEMPVTGTTALSFDEALKKSIGELGRGQLRILLLASLCWIPNAFVILLMVFNNKNPVKEHWFKCNDPLDTCCASVYALADPSSEFCSLAPSQYTWTSVSKSIISQFNLVCSNGWKSQLVNSVFFLGYLVGSGVFGNVADSWGRRKSLVAATLLCAVSTLAQAASPNYWVYFVIRMVSGVGAAGQAVSTYILATEMVGASWRGAAGIATQLFFIVGEFVLTLFAFLFQGWRELCIVTAILCVASLVPLFFTPESARWLLVRGDKEKAMAVLGKLCAWNRTSLPSEPLADSSGTPGEKMTLRAVLKDTHILRRFIVLAYAWLVLCMTYYGISLALNGLKGSIYVTFMIAAIAEFPSYLLGGWLIEKIGRHNTMAAGMLLGGLSCIICAFVPPGIAQSVTAAFGKFGCAGAFGIASIFTSELFPTLVRSAVLGAENEAARVGGIAAPFIVLLGTSLNATSLPFLIFGVTSITAGALIFTLPETLGLPTPDTMKDMAVIRSIFSNQSWKRGWKEATKSMFKTKATPATGSAATPATAPEHHHHGDEEHHSLLGGQWAPSTANV